MVSPKTLVTPRRLDLAVKWRFFRHLITRDDQDSERVYRWHIETRNRPRWSRGLPVDIVKYSITDYLEGAGSLKRSMSMCGFEPSYSLIPVDPDGELLGGAHRTACALALGIDCYIEHREERAWAPPWDRQWFIDNGMSEEDLTRTLADFEMMRHG